MPEFMASNYKEDLFEMWMFAVKQRLVWEKHELISLMC